MTDEEKLQLAQSIFPALPSHHSFHIGWDTPEERRKMHRLLDSLYPVVHWNSGAKASAYDGHLGIATMLVERRGSEWYMWSSSRVRGTLGHADLVGRVEGYNDG